MRAELAKHAEKLATHSSAGAQELLKAMKQR